MDSIPFLLLQLVLVTVVYFAAYRNGYKEAQQRIQAVVRELSHPISSTLENLDKSVDDLLKENKKAFRKE